MELRQLRQLSNELGNPGAQPLWLAVQRQGIKLLKKDAEAFVKRKGEKQVFAAVQPSKGKTVGESLDARWQIDLAFGVKAEGYTAYLVAVNVFDRFTYAVALESKEPAQVAAALKKLIKDAPKKPKLISSDNGN